MQKIFSILSIAIFMVLYYALWLITLPYFILRLVVTLVERDEETVEVADEGGGQAVAGT